MNDFDIYDIEQELTHILRDTIKVSKTVYNNRPKSAVQVSDYVVAKVSGGVVDLEAYGTCTIVIQMFAKNVNNMKNGKMLSVMYKKLVAGLPSSVGRYIFETSPTIIGDTEDDYGYSCRIISIKTVIKVKQ